MLKTVNHYQFKLDSPTSGRLVVTGAINGDAVNHYFHGHLKAFRFIQVQGYDFLQVGLDKFNSEAAILSLDLRNKAAMKIALSIGGCMRDEYTGITILTDHPLHSEAVIKSLVIQPQGEIKVNLRSAWDLLITGNSGSAFKQFNAIADFIKANVVTFNEAFFNEYPVATPMYQEYDIASLAKRNEVAFNASLIN